MRAWLCAALMFGVAAAAPTEGPASTPLLDAAMADDLVEVTRLLAAGADPSEANRYGTTAAELACLNGNAPMLKALIKAGAGGLAAPKLLQTAVRTGDANCVKLLLENGSDPNARGAGDQTALMWAADAGHTAAMELLLAAGADPKIRLDSGFDALLFAVRAGHLEATRRLLYTGLDVNAAAEPDNAKGRNMRSGTAPLMLAVENGHFELALELVKSGADPNDQRSGFTPLHAISWVRKSVRGDGPDGIPPPQGKGGIGSLDFVRQLIAAGADVNAPLKDGGGGTAKIRMKGATPFLMAASTCDLPLLQLLHELGADPTIHNADDLSPLLATCGMGVTAPGEEAGFEVEAIACARYLLDLGADINHVSQRAETVMHAAAYKSAPKLIAFLDEEGADIQFWNQKNKAGWTPLLIAQGFRPGNFRPIQYTIDALSAVMRAHGVEPPPAPPPPGR